MANRIIASGDAHPIPPVGGPQAPVDTTLIATAVDEIASLNNLVRWVGRARDFIEGIETGRRLCPAFAEQLKTRDFDHVDVEWDSDVSEGLETLHLSISGLLTTISKAVRAEVAK